MDAGLVRRKRGDVKLEEKREVIEVLLCTASTRNGSVFHIQESLDLPNRVGFRAMNKRQSSKSGVDCDAGYHYSQSCTEAAYRLIESSPTLRREWFGAP